MFLFPFEYINISYISQLLQKCKLDFVRKSLVLVKHLKPNNSCTGVLLFELSGFSIEK